MAELTVCTPLRIERAAVRPALRGVRLVRIGLGPSRAARRSAPEADRTGPLAVLGVAGGVAAHVRPGDVVVADEVRGPDGTIRCPSAPLLAGGLRRAGLRVHVGPLLSLPPTAAPADLSALAGTDVLAVDQETAAVAAVAGTRPFAAVRVVTDTAGAPLLRPGIVGRGVRALRTLAVVAPVLREWAAAAGPREVLLASPRSFCAGVDRAIEIVERALQRYGAPVYVRRQVVHNAHVIARLERLGAVFVPEVDDVPRGATVVLAAHGVAPQVRADAAARRLTVVDATCPLVGKVHAEVRRYAGRGDTVLLVGHHDHEEVVGTVGEAPGAVLVVADAQEARTVTVPDARRVAYVMQTTLSLDEASEVSGVLRERFPSVAAPRSDDICYATSNRQEALRAVAAECEVVLVVGSANSSNSRRLVEVAERAGVPAHLVDDVGEVVPAWLVGAARVGVTAGASAPPQLVDELVDCLSGLGPVTVRERGDVVEDIRFTLPKEVS